MTIDIGSLPCVAQFGGTITSKLYETEIFSTLAGRWLSPDSTDLAERLGAERMEALLDLLADLQARAR